MSPTRRRSCRRSPRRLAPGGLLILSTPNATAWSQLLMITLAEGLGRIPKGTHDFDKFIAPERMKLLLADAGLSCLDVEGIAWSPTRGLHLSDDVRLNYLVAASTTPDRPFAELDDEPCIFVDEPSESARVESHSSRNAQGSLMTVIGPCGRLG